MYGFLIQNNIVLWYNKMCVINSNNGTSINKHMYSGTKLSTVAPKHYTS